MCNLVGFSVSGGRDGRGQTGGAVLLIGQQVEENQRSCRRTKGRKIEDLMQKKNGRKSAGCVEGAEVPKLWPQTDTAPL